MTVDSNADDITLIEFSDYKVKNYKTDKVDLFDVTTEGFLNIPPDFAEGMPLFHKYYCTCLLRKVSTYHISQLFSFLDHQFKSLRHPDKWLRNFDSLLHLNKTYFLTVSSEEKYEALRKCIKDRLLLMNNMVREEVPEYGLSTEDRARFDMKEIKKDLKSVRGFENKKNVLLRWRADYLQDIEENPKARFIRKIDIELEFITATRDSINEASVKEKIIFNGTIAHLSSIVGQLFKLENKDGLLFVGSVNAICQFVCGSIVDKNGKPFKESTLNRNLTNFNAGNLSSKNKIQLDFDPDFDPESDPDN